ncbi:unnamed protein product [Pedinophyceae sp. YPF-701]|nr:unnamed protein product [Pedinophyceae sp. YPF-701]
MFAKLSALVSGAGLPFTLGAHRGAAWGQWQLYDGTWKEDSSSVSIMKISSRDPTDRALEAARNGVKRLRATKHPNILAFKGSHEAEEKGEAVIYLVTEQFQPLPMALTEMQLEPAEREDWFAMGLKSIFQAVTFLSNDCKLIHGNVCLSSVAVTTDLDWKLFAFDLLSEHTGATSGGNFPLFAATILTSPHRLPGEVARGDWDTVARSPPWAVDAWGLGVLLQEAHAGQPLARQEDLRNLQTLPHGLHKSYQTLLASTPAKRANPAQVLEGCHHLRQSRAAEAVAFLEGLAIQSDEAKAAFFKRLPSTVLPHIPQQLAARRLLPLLSRALEFGGAPPTALESLLAIGSRLEQADFEARVVPTLAKLFSSQDRALRVSLLQTMDKCGHLLSDHVVETQIYPNVSTGFSDTVPYLREMTLKSMLILAPKLKQKTLINSLLKHLSKLQVDNEPGIRANATILLSNIARHLGTAQCRKVLLNAFTRALKDQFPASRSAALNALAATLEYYTPREMAERLLPATAPFCVDLDGPVRQAALRCVDGTMAVMRETSKKLENGEGGIDAAACESASATAPGAAASGGGYLSWAAGLIKPTLGGARAEKEQQGSAAASAPPAAPPPPPPPARPAAAVPAPAPLIDGAADDGWGDDDDAFADMLGSAAPASTATAPAASAAPPAAASSATAGGDGWGDEDALWESLASSGGGGAAAAPAQPAARGGGPPMRARAAAGGRGGGRAMKLGAQKLGVQKLGAAKVDDDAFGDLLS